MKIDSLQNPKQLPMNPILRNILAVFAGVVLGSTVNMSIIMVSSSIIPPPEGVDVTTVEGLKASMHLFQPINFLMPWLAHALGTLTGAFLTAFLAANNKMKFALGIGVLFLVGGTINVFMLPSPMWFNIADLAGAYIPMGYLGAKIAERKIK